MSSPTIPKSMRAWLVTGVGSPKDALEFKANLPVPAAPQGSNIMVRVSYAALNPLDLVMMEARIPFRRPAGAAVDFVGEIVQAGKSANKDLQLGMIVCGTVPTNQIIRGYGVLSEYIVVPDWAAAEKPSGLIDTAAVGLMGVAGQTTTVLAGTKLSQGARVLVNGASGGVGSLLIQVLSAKGYHVTGICSKKNEAMILRLGAKESVDYTAPGSVYNDIASKAQAKPFDAIMDCIGDADLYKNSPRYLKDDGKYLTIAGSFFLALKTKIQPGFLGGVPRTYARVNNDPAGFRAKEAGGWFTAGWIKEVPIDECYDMNHVVEAFEKLATKRVRGKVIVKVAQ